MSPRLVVTFRWHSVETLPDRYLAAAERVRRRLHQIGGRAIGWAGDHYSFEFDPESFRLVLKTTLDLISEANTHAVGISARELTVGENSLSWGPALVVAEALASAAAPGEVLIDPEVAEAQTGLLESFGTVPTRIGEQIVEGVLLLPGACPVDGFKPSIGQTEDDLPTQKISDPPPPPANRGPSAARTAVSSTPPPNPRSLLPQTNTPVPGTLASASPLHSKSEQPSRHARRDSGGAENGEAASRSSYWARDERPSVLEALKSGDPVLMGALATALRQTRGHERLALRLEAMASLARGDVEMGLQGLADALSAARISGGPEQCQAALAYAVGLSQVGRKEEAFRETLWALERARETPDPKGERACCQLAAQLASSAGEDQAAERWREAAAAVDVDTSGRL